MENCRSGTDLQLKRRSAEFIRHIIICKIKSANHESLDYDGKIKMIVDMLYNERNAFVHKARLPQLSDQNVKMLGCYKGGV